MQYKLDARNFHNSTSVVLNRLLCVSKAVILQTVSYLSFYLPSVCVIIKYTLADAFAVVMHQDNVVNYHYSILETKGF